ncbi:MAG: transglutaminase family protein [Bernardetiaceae bacterium]|nr:transglutaminase family protein [Bernardetiaceae bacterium]
MQNLEVYLIPTFFIDSDNAEVVAFAQKHTTPTMSEKERAVALYYAVRDGFRYDPYKIDLRREALPASRLLGRNAGYCVEKANLLAAAARAVGVPSRLGFSIVRNHIGTAKLEQMLRTDTLVFHGYTELYLGGKWCKATPAFNAALCEKLGVEPLAFDGENDSIFQSHEGGGFMEYLHDYGNFSDLPHELFVSELRKHYPHIFEQIPIHTKDFMFIV